VVVIGEGQEAFVVTARDMTEAEKNTFRRKARDDYDQAFRAASPVGGRA
jgi:hypothetical protein